MKRVGGKGGRKKGRERRELMTNALAMYAAIPP